MDASPRTDAARPGRLERLRTGARSFGGGAALYPLFVLFGLNAVDELDRTAFSLLLPEIRREFGLGFTGVNLLLTAIIPVGLIFGIPIGLFADRRRRVPITLVAGSVWAVFSFLTGLASTVVLLGLARIGSGLGKAVNDPVHGSLLSDYYPPGVRMKVFGAHRAANTVGSAIGPVIAGFLAAAYGWRTPFFVFAVPTLLFLFFAMRLREPPRTGERRSESTLPIRESVRVLWGIRTLRWMWLAIPFLAAVAIGLTPQFALYYGEIFGVDAGARGVIQSLDTPFILVGFFVGAPLLDRALARDPALVIRAMAAGAIAIAGLIVCMALAPRLWMGIVCVYAIVMIAVVLLAGGTAVISLVSPPDVRATAFSFYGVFALLGVPSLVIVGAVSDARGLRWGIGMLAPLLLIGATVIRRAGRFIAGDLHSAAPDRAVEAAAVEASPPVPGT
jgi:predicted MFS family arabinose efflux permease